MAKQETLHDILKTMSYYNDAIILRHPNENEVFDNIKNINPTILFNFKVFIIPIFKVVIYIIKKVS